jgi:hypothetical protein
VSRDSEVARIAAVLFGFREPLDGDLSAVRTDKAIIEAGIARMGHEIAAEQARRSASAVPEPTDLDVERTVAMLAGGALDNYDRLVATGWAVNPMPDHDAVAAWIDSRLAATPPGPQRWRLR